jgi:hypothetical protein
VYAADNPFHCFRHAFTVTQHVWLFLADRSEGACCHALQELDCLALLLAAMCHDLEHPGTTNAFQARGCCACCVRWLVQPHAGSPPDAAHRTLPPGQHRDAPGAAVQ